ncbi:hypothetical protein NIES592_15650 [Fischerella major NIES-592]|uniref:Uncharacterized protein n=1 Tax=Fischerella major NIES-592 TaxID=210994 RepID=A0A1U7GXJ2_9CYAN|nr:hypothetical protein NIES592_15650 [Fischerella major NIES-592]
MSDRFPNTHTNPHNHRLEQFLAAITPANPQYSPFKPQHSRLKLKNSHFQLLGFSHYLITHYQLPTFTDIISLQTDMIWLVIITKQTELNDY